MDDDPVVLDRLRSELEADYRVISASSPEQAIIELEREEIDLLVTDQKMPRMTGLELVARAKEIAPTVPAILLTSYTDPADLITAINRDLLYRYIDKPWDPADLRATVSNALEARALRSERDALVNRLERRLDALSILNEVSAAAGDLATPAEIAGLLTQALHRIVRFDVAASLIAPHARNLPAGYAGAAHTDSLVMHLHCQTACDEGTLMTARDRCLDLYRTLTSRETSEDQLLVEITGDRARDLRLQPRVTSSTHIPLVIDGHVVGILYLLAFRARAFTPDDEKLLYVLANQTSEAVRRLSTRVLDERRKMGLMVESMADGVIMTDEHSEVFLLNPAARRMLGIAPDVAVTSKYLKERLGFYPFDLVVRQAADSALSPSGVGVVREELKVDDKVLHSIVSPVFDAGGKLVGVVVVLRDITERKELDRRKEEFVSVVSHELRTPLTSITGALDIILNDYAGGVSDKQRRYLTMARESCSKLNAIVDDLLDVARFERGKMPMQFRSISLDTLAGECVERYRAATEAKKVAMQFRTDRQDIRIVGDADRLTQVMNNLLSNAIKFTPDGGRIEVEVFGPGVASNHVGLSVWNNGETIPEASRERVFDKFEQVQASSTRRVGGTGLGLAISRSIVEGHGGQIWVENSATGTKFVLTLPSAPSDTAETHVEVDAGSSEEQPSGKNVLVVDDDRYTTYILKGVLMASGHKVHVAHDADEALTMAREKKPDLVTVDVLMPGVDGLALVEILKHDPETKKAAVVVVSGATDRDRSIAAGADAFLPKPIDVEAFRECCARLILERGRASQIKVLVVDDDPGIRMICREVLESAGYVVREAPDGASALVEARRFRPDLMLLDVMMPDLDGFQTAKRFRSEAYSSMTPVIFVSARGQTADKVRAFKLGADDYLVKPFDAAELVARVAKALERKERELGASPTTKLPGAGAIELEIERRLTAAAAAGGSAFAFCYLDLDNLKAFNDYYGYAKADGVIRQTGDLVREVVGREGNAGDFIGHIAGDDFVFITSIDRCDRICATVVQTFDRLVPLYYNKVDRERGYIETYDRYGELRKFPIMSVSIAALTTLRGATHAELATLAAEAKKRAKAIVGSAYVRDHEVVLPAAKASKATVG